jgi:hypothetical protein
MAELSYFYAHQASPIVDSLEQIVPIQLWPLWSSYVVYPVGKAGRNTTTGDTAFNRVERPSAHDRNPLFHSLDWNPS